MIYKFSISVKRWETEWQDGKKSYVTRFVLQNDFFRLSNLFIDVIIYVEVVNENIKKYLL